MNTGNLLLPFQKYGSIQILGTAVGRSDSVKIVCVAKNIECNNPDILYKQVKETFRDNGCDDCIVLERTYIIDSKPKYGLEITFVYEIDGTDVDNPEGLLRNIRTKLVHVINAVDTH